MPTKNISVSTWALVSSNRCVNLVLADQAHVDNSLKSQFQAVENATNLLPDYEVRIGDIYDPKSRKFSRPT